MCIAIFKLCLFSKVLCDCDVSNYTIFSSSPVFLKTNKVFEVQIFFKT